MENRLRYITSLFVDSCAAGVLSRAYGGGNIYHRTPSHNDLPVPQGDWYEKYQKTQARYNTQLAGSVLLFVGVVVYVS